MLRRSNVPVAENDNTFTPLPRNITPVGIQLDPDTGVDLSNPEKQDILEELDVKTRVDKAIKVLSKEIQRIKLGEEIQTEVHDEITKSQREHFLREQMKAIKRELGEDESQVELNEIEDAIKKAKMPEDAEKVALKELDLSLIHI